MGMRDESWCNGCGTSLPYSDEDETYCGDCATDNAKQDLLLFVEYRIADLTEKRKEYEAEGDNSSDDYCAGAIDAYDIIRMKLTDEA